MTYSEVVRKLVKCGVQVWLVGDAVLDTINGKVLDDLDIGLRPPSNTWNLDRVLECIGDGITLNRLQGDHWFSAGEVIEKQIGDSSSESLYAFQIGPSHFQRVDGVDVMLVGFGRTMGSQSTPFQCI